MKTIRVFPRRTKATPDDDMAFIGDVPLFRPEADEVHISCTFTWDREYAKYLRGSWARFYSKVRIGGPAFDDPGDEFEPAMYLRKGFVITTRGCPNRCPFCFVPEREGGIRTLNIKNGHDIQDNNLLAAPREHIEAVFDMLDNQPKPARFTGGFEARRIEPWVVERLANMRIDELFIGYDRPADKPHVHKAVGLLRAAGLKQRAIRCYVLAGYGNDTVDEARERLEWVFNIGALPFAMYYQNAKGNGERGAEWKRLIRQYSRPAAMFATKT